MFQRNCYFGLIGVGTLKSLKRSGSEHRQYRIYQIDAKTSIKKAVTFMCQLNLLIIPFFNVLQGHFCY